ncbi:XRE family transcriptional regulator, partial [Streptococcus suis]
MLDLIWNYLEARDKVKPMLLGLISAKHVKDELCIKDKTLKRWEDNGQRRNKPPLEYTSKNIYRVSDILIFLGV